MGNDIITDNEIKGLTNITSLNLMGNEIISAETLNNLNKL